MSPSFSDLGVPAALVNNLAKRGIREAFPIQALALPPALEGRDVCGRAPTGSGKTLAFGLPLAHRVGRGRSLRPRALVLAPTRELAAQIEAELKLLLGPYQRSVASFYGGVGLGPQMKILRRGVDVVVGCPGRLEDLIARGQLILDDVTTVVIDEADRMADMGFLPVVKRLVDQTPEHRQTLLFSATLDGDVDVLIRRYQRDPFRCDVVPDQEQIDLTTHHFQATRREDRVAATVALVVEHGSTVVFCRTKHGADRLAGQLIRSGVDAVAMHGGRSQAQRDRALRAFSGGTAQALVATDVAARGIHVDNVACVVHYDLAGDHKDYVHRSGRTGRAGAAGVVVSFVTEADEAQAHSLRRALGLVSGPAPVTRGPSARGAGRSKRASSGRAARAAGHPAPSAGHSSRGRRGQSGHQRRG